MLNVLKKDYIFLFDLDSTITQKEILPEIAKRVGKEQKMRELTEATMRGELPFKTSFLKRIAILNEISVEDVSNLVAEIPLNKYILNFIGEGISSTLKLLPVKSSAPRIYSSSFAR